LESLKPEPDTEAASRVQGSQMGFEFSDEFFPEPHCQIGIDQAK
jgi:hypothetical protein